MLDRAREAGRLLNACRVNGKFDGKKFVGPSAAFEDFFAPDKRAPFKAYGNARAVATCKIKLFPEL